jgi:hypothetical protein
VDIVGSALDSGSGTYNAMTGSATVRLTRQAGGSGNSHNGRAWQVLIDGSVVGPLPNNEPTGSAS